MRVRLIPHTLFVLAALLASAVTPLHARAQQRGDETKPSSVRATDVKESPGEREKRYKLYAKFLKNYRGGPREQKVAYKAVREYLKEYSYVTYDGAERIVNYLRAWGGKYEEAVVKFECVDGFNRKDYEKVFRACGVALSRRPDNVGAALLIVRAGYADATSRSPKRSLNADAARIARRAVELIASS